MMRRLACITALIALWSSAALADINITVANAPGVLSSHAYTMPARVNAGAGWDGTNWTPGSAVCLFALTVAGTTGAGAPTAFNTACASGTAANTGGGLDGTVPAGWSPATTVTSGGATFVLLKKSVDYVTHTGMSCDDAAWQPNTTYEPRTFVVNGGNCYQQGNIFGAASCVSGNSGGPTGTTPGADGTCTGASVWTYMGALTYSSNANKWPHQLLHDQGGGNFAAETQYLGHVTVTYWWGGRAITESLNGESSPIRLWSHQQFEPGDNDTWCLGQVGVTNVPNCSPLTYYTLTVAPGDSFVDNIVPGTGPLAYDETKGVAFHGTASNAANQEYFGQSLDLADSYGIVKRFQFKSDLSTCLPTTAFGNFIQSDGHTNGVTLVDNIIDCNGGEASVQADAGWILQNNVIIRRASSAGSVLIAKYDTQLASNTFLGPGTGVANTACVVVLTMFSGADQIASYSDNALFGCAHSFAYQNAEAWTGQGNATSGPSSDSGTITIPWGSPTVAVFPGVGSNTGLLGANQFVNGAADMRLKSTADIRGAGVNYSLNSSFYWQNVNLGATVPSPDILGTTRPQAGAYDVGAFEFVSSAAGSGSALLFRRR